ncbi:SPOSA6832_02407 [Sporobolomyces salmonicolor]|uniref:SPOSA6832_02407-mRNA-1:cds n=1 Tax=Sporidiobolus salmonicolor TaxID=5005 RepID=A0A0D6ELA5_SPOSA|nr:SPOSA6832_02407 [Sporobolomyces salmonicolor]
MPARSWPNTIPHGRVCKRRRNWNGIMPILRFGTVTTQNSIALPTGGTTAGLKAFLLRTTTEGKNPLMTLGGWSGSVYFSSLVSTSKSRATFANTIKSWVTTYGFGGVDLDWEFRGCQTTSYQALNTLQLGVKVKERTSSRLTTRPTTSRSSPSFAIPSERACSSRLPFPPPDWGERHADHRRFIVRQLPRLYLPSLRLFSLELIIGSCPGADLTLMSYDYYGPWSSTTGPNSALYTCNAGSDSVDETVKRWVGWGFPACKLLVGTPGYSHRWKTDTASISTTTYNGQETTAFQSLSATTIEDDSWTVNQLISMGYLSQDLSTGLSGYVRYYDSCTQTPFLFSKSDQIFVTYEDDASFAAKAAYAKANGLAGVAIYDSTGPTSSMFEAAAAGLGRSSSSSTTSPARSSTTISATPTTSVIRTTTTTSQSATTTSRSTTTTSSSLAPTASSSTCSVTADCTNTVPKDAHRYCSSKICTFKCNTGYTLSNGACIKPSATSTTTAAAKTTTSAKAATTTTTSTKPAKTTTSSAKAAASSATSSSCTVTADCANVVPSNSHHYCASKVCSFSASRLPPPSFRVQRKPAYFPPPSRRVQHGLHLDRKCLRQVRLVEIAPQAQPRRGRARARSGEGRAAGWVGSGRRD